jgi:mannose-6-phosphate isomerase-like protein (cupin superfamily)
MTEFRLDASDGNGLWITPRVRLNWECTMPNETIDLSQNNLLLESDGTVVQLPGGGAFWSQLMSGAPTDPGIRQLMGSPKGRLLTTVSIDADWKNWEMHPAGDEILIMTEGRATFVLELAAGSKEVDLSAGRLLVVPQGVWHTARMIQPARLIAITAGAGTRHRPG